MFLDRLNDTQKGSFLALATRLVMADGEITDEEAALLEKLKQEMGGNVTAPPEEVFGNINLAAFEGHTTQAIVLFELLSLAFSDEKLHINEQEVLDGIEDNFDIPAEEIQKLNLLSRKRCNGEDVREEAEAAIAAVS